MDIDAVDNGTEAEVLFPWEKHVRKKLVKSFPNVKTKVINSLFKSICEEFEKIDWDDKKRIISFYETLKYFYLHFCWKIKWEEGSYLETSCILILYYMSYIALRLSNGKITSEWLNQILLILKTYPGNFYKICDVLLLIKNMKKKYHFVYAEILKFILHDKKLKNPVDAECFVKIMLLVRRFKALSSNDLEKRDISSLASTIKCPPNTLNWITAFKIDSLCDITQENIAEKLIEKKLQSDVIQQLFLALFENKYDEKILNIARLSSKHGASTSSTANECDVKIKSEKGFKNKRNRKQIKKNLHGKPKSKISLRKLEESLSKLGKIKKKTSKNKQPPSISQTASESKICEEDMLNVSKDALLVQNLSLNTSANEITENISLERQYKFFSNNTQTPADAFTIGQNKESPSKLKVLKNNRKSLLETACIESSCSEIVSVDNEEAFGESNNSLCDIQVNENVESISKSKKAKRKLGMNQSCLIQSNESSSKLKVLKESLSGSSNIQIPSSETINADNELYFGESNNNLLEIQVSVNIESTSKLKEAKLKLSVDQSYLIKSNESPSKLKLLKNKPESLFETSCFEIISTDNELSFGQSNKKETSDIQTPCSEIINADNPLPFSHNNKSLPEMQITENMESTSKSKKADIKLGMNESYLDKSINSFTEDSPPVPNHEDLHVSIQHANRSFCMDHISLKSLHVNTNEINELPGASTLKQKRTKRKQTTLYEYFSVDSNVKNPCLISPNNKRIKIENESKNKLLNDSSQKFLQGEDDQNANMCEESSPELNLSVEKTSVLANQEEDNREENQTLLLDCKIFPQNVPGSFQSDQPLINKWSVFDKIHGSNENFGLMNQKEDNSEKSQSQPNSCQSINFSGKFDACNSKDGSVTPLSLDFGEKNNALNIEKHDGEESFTGIPHCALSIQQLPDSFELNKNFKFNDTSDTDQKSVNSIASNKTNSIECNYSNDTKNYDFAQKNGFSVNCPHMSYADNLHASDIPMNNACSENNDYDFPAVSNDIPTDFKSEANSTLHAANESLFEVNKNTENKAKNKDEHDLLPAQASSNSLNLAQKEESPSKFEVSENISVSAFQPCGAANSDTMSQNKDLNVIPQSPCSAKTLDNHNSIYSSPESLDLNSRSCASVDSVKVNILEKSKSIYTSSEDLDKNLSDISISPNIRTSSGRRASKIKSFPKHLFPSSALELDTSDPPVYLQTRRRKYRRATFSKKFISESSSDTDDEKKVSKHASSADANSLQKSKTNFDNNINSNVEENTSDKILKNEVSQLNIKRKRPFNKKVSSKHKVENKFLSAEAKLKSIPCPFSSDSNIVSSFEGPLISNEENNKKQELIKKNSAAKSALSVETFLENDKEIPVRWKQNESKEIISDSVLSSEQSLPKSSSPITVNFNDVGENKTQEPIKENLDSESALSGEHFSKTVGKISVRKKQYKSKEITSNSDSSYEQSLKKNSDAASALSEESFSENDEKISVIKKQYMSKEITSDSDSSYEQSLPKSSTPKTLNCNNEGNNKTLEPMGKNLDSESTLSGETFSENKKIPVRWKQYKSKEIISDSDSSSDQSISKSSSPKTMNFNDEGENKIQEPIKKNLDSKSALSEEPISKNYGEISVRKKQRKYKKITSTSDSSYEQSLKKNSDAASALSEESFSEKDETIPVIKKQYKSKEITSDSDSSYEQSLPKSSTPKTLNCNDEGNNKTQKPMEENLDSESSTPGETFAENDKEIPVRWKQYKSKEIISDSDSSSEQSLSKLSSPKTMNFNDEGENKIQEPIMKNLDSESALSEEPISKQYGETSVRKKQYKSKEIISTSDSSYEQSLKKNSNVASALSEESLSENDEKISVRKKQYKSKEITSDSDSSCEQNLPKSSTPKALNFNDVDSDETEEPIKKNSNAESALSEESFSENDEKISVRKKQYKSKEITSDSDSSCVQNLPKSSTPKALNFNDVDSNETEEPIKKNSNAESALSGERFSVNDEGISIRKKEYKSKEIISTSDSYEQSLAKSNVLKSFDIIDEGDNKKTKPLKENLDSEKDFSEVAFSENDEKISVRKKQYKSKEITSDSDSSCVQNLPKSSTPKALNFNDVDSNETEEPIKKNSNAESALSGERFSVNDEGISVRKKEYKSKEIISTSDSYEQSLAKSNVLKSFDIIDEGDNKNSKPLKENLDSEKDFSEVAFSENDEKISVRKKQHKSKEVTFDSDSSYEESLPKSSTLKTLNCNDDEISKESTNLAKDSQVDLQQYCDKYSGDLLLKHEFEGHQKSDKTTSESDDNSSRKQKIQKQNTEKITIFQNQEASETDPKLSKTVKIILEDYYNGKYFLTKSQQRESKKLKKSKRTISESDCESLVERMQSTSISLSNSNYEKIEAPFTKQFQLFQDCSANDIFLTNSLFDSLRSEKYIQKCNSTSDKTFISPSSPISEKSCASSLPSTVAASSPSREQERELAFKSDSKWNSNCIKTATRFSTRLKSKISKLEEQPLKLSGEVFNSDQNDRSRSVLNSSFENNGFESDSTVKNDSESGHALDDSSQNADPKCFLDQSAECSELDSKSEYSENESENDSFIDDHESDESDELNTSNENQSVHYKYSGNNSRCSSRNSSPVIKRKSNSKVRNKKYLSDSDDSDSQNALNDSHSNVLRNSSPISSKNSSPELKRKSNSRMRNKKYLLDSDSSENENDLNSSCSNISPNLCINPSPELESKSNEEKVKLHVQEYNSDEVDDQNSSNCQSEQCSTNVESDNNRYISPQNSLKKNEVLSNEKNCKEGSFSSFKSSLCKLKGLSSQTTIVDFDSKEFCEQAVSNNSKNIIDHKNCSNSVNLLKSPPSDLKKIYNKSKFCKKSVIESHSDDQVISENLGEALNYKSVSINDSACNNSSCSSRNSSPVIKRKSYGKVRNKKYLSDSEDSDSQNALNNSHSNVLRNSSTISRKNSSPELKRKSNSRMRNKKYLLDSDSSENDLNSSCSNISPNLCINSSPELKSKTIEEKIKFHVQEYNSEEVDDQNSFNGQSEQCSTNVESNNNRYIGPQNSLKKNEVLSNEKNCKEGSFSSFKSSLCKLKGLSSQTTIVDFDSKESCEQAISNNSKNIIDHKNYSNSVNLLKSPPTDLKKIDNKSVIESHSDDQVISENLGEALNYKSVSINDSACSKNSPSILKGWSSIKRMSKSSAAENILPKCDAKESCKQLTDKQQMLNNGDSLKEKTSSALSDQCQSDLQQSGTYIENHNSLMCFSQCTTSVVDHDSEINLKCLESFSFSESFSSPERPSQSLTVSNERNDNSTCLVPNSVTDTRKKSHYHPIVNRYFSESDSSMSNDAEKVAKMLSKELNSSKNSLNIRTDTPKVKSLKRKRSCRINKNKNYLKSSNSKNVLEKDKLASKRVCKETSPAPFSDSSEDLPLSKIGKKLKANDVSDVKNNHLSRQSHRSISLSQSTDSSEDLRLWEISKKRTLPVSPDSGISCLDNKSSKDDCTKKNAVALASLKDDLQFVNPLKVEHCQSKENSYESSNTKQSVDKKSANFEEREKFCNNSATEISKCIKEFESCSMTGIPEIENHLSGDRDLENNAGHLTFLEQSLPSSLENFSSAKDPATEKLKGGVEICDQLINHYSNMKNSLDDQLENNVLRLSPSVQAQTSSQDIFSSVKEFCESQTAIGLKNNTSEITPTSDKDNASQNYFVNKDDEMFFETVMEKLHNDPSSFPSEEYLKNSFINNILDSTDDTNIIKPTFLSECSKPLVFNDSNCLSASSLSSISNDTNTQQAYKYCSSTTAKGDSELNMTAELCQNEFALNSCSEICHFENILEKQSCKKMSLEPLDNQKLCDLDNQCEKNAKVLFICDVEKKSCKVHLMPDAFLNDILDKSADITRSSRVSANADRCKCATCYSSLSSRCSSDECNKSISKSTDRNKINRNTSGGHFYINGIQVSTASIFPVVNLGKRCDENALNSDCAGKKELSGMSSGKRVDGNPIKLTEKKLLNYGSSTKSKVGSTQSPSQLRENADAKDRSAKSIECHRKKPRYNLRQQRKGL